MKHFILTAIFSFFISLNLFSQYIAADTSLANEYFAKAIAFKTNSQYDSAIVCFEKASNLYQNNNLWLKYLKSETNHGECYQKQWQMNKAIAIIKSAIENTLLYTVENDTVVADAYHKLGLQ